MQILIVDDDDFALDALENTLARMGHSCVSARDGRQAMEILCGSEIRLVVTDWDMPGADGIDLCRNIRREDLSGYVYIIMLTGREGAKQRMEGLCAGADDFLNKPLDPEELLVCLKTAERILALETRDVALFALAKLAESRDNETGAHVERVQAYVRLIAQNLSAEVRTCNGIDEEYIRLLYQTSPLHDLGKVSIPDSVLLKPDKLTPDEFAIMKTHTIVGAQTLDAALQRFPNTRFLQIARDIAASHHEKFDGSGYPSGLAGDQIPICGRIVAVADVYDALTSRRVYKAAMSHEEAVEIIQRIRGSHFDPDVVDAFLAAQKAIIEIGGRLRDEFENAKPHLAIPAPPAPAQCRPSPSKILIVEDDALLMERLKQLLAATGETILCAANGREGLAAFQQSAPHVVVSDWCMPEMDGLELCKEIRQQEGDSRVHFIMLTAHSEKGRLLEAYDAGADDFIGKPFDQEELLARARAGIRASMLRSELLRKANGSQALNGQLAMLNSRLERLSMTDELTGLFNRRHAFIRLEEQWDLVERYGRPLTIAMIDVDHFKRVNDIHGHSAGDVILRCIAGLLRDQTRGTDAVCRVGGEEFLIVFPAQTVQEAAICAERCRTVVAGHQFEIGGLSLNATVSIGLATRLPGMTRYTELMNAADEALYAAKNGGRDRICIASLAVGPGEKHASHPIPRRLASAAPPSITHAAVEVDKAVLKETTMSTSPLNVPLNVSESSSSIQAAAVAIAASAADGPASARLVKPPVDSAALLKRCGNDVSFAAAVAAKFEAQAAAEVQKLQDALAGGKMEAVQRTAHSIKSMAAFMGADSASDLARQIEEIIRSGVPDAPTAIPPLISRLTAEIDRAKAWIAVNRNLLRCA